jgi:hypothetical protein
MTDNADDVLRQKTTRLEAAKLKVQQFLDSGGDLKSKEVVPIGVEFIEAFNNLAKELSSDAREQAAAKEARSQSMQDFLKLFAFTKKKELEKYCRDLVVHQEDLVNFILTCEIRQGPFLHLIHYGDHQPEEAQLTDDDLAALAKSQVGPLDPGAQKTVNKIGHLFRVRRYLVGHIFYTPDLSEWHFFQFDQRDLEDTRPNHWKEGAHMHFINWLWPNRDAKTLWEDFTSGKAKTNDSLHVRFSTPPVVGRSNRGIKVTSSK